MTRTSSLDLSRRLSVAMAIVGAFAIADAATTAMAAEKPPLRPDVPTPAVVPSHVSASITFPIAALERALEHKVPKNIATFSSGTRSCWQRRVLGREVDVDCSYSGSVERTGPVTLHAEGNRLSGAVPLFGAVAAHGVHGLVGLLHGTAEGAMTVVVDSRPQLRTDWSVALNLSEGYRWRETPTLHILGFSIGLTRFIEPQIQKHLESIQGDVAEAVRALDLRGKATTAWRHAFANVKLSDEPEIWLRTTPQSVAFSGIRAHGPVLEGSIEIKGSAESVVGAAPEAQTPTPLPGLGHDVTEPGRFDVLIPMMIGYATIAQTLKSIVAAHLGAGSAAGDVALNDVSIYPSEGKVVFELRLGRPPSGDGPAASATIVLTATPRFDADAQAVAFADLTAIGDDAMPAAAASMFADGKLLETLRQQLRVRYQAVYDSIVASANSRLTRPLGDGFHSEGRLTAATAEKIFALADGLRVDVRASGHLAIRYAN